MKQPPDPNDPLAVCPCGYRAYTDQTFLVDNVFVARIVVYRCAGVVKIRRDGRIKRLTACFHPMDHETAVTEEDLEKSP